MAAAIAVHDTVELTAAAPSIIPNEFDSQFLRRCYWISHQLWKSLDAEEMRGVARELMISGRLTPDRLAALKDFRARAKQLRFAFGLLDRDGKYPWLLDRVTRIMGHAQDAARSERRTKAALWGLLLRIVSSPQVLTVLAREVDAFAAAPPADVRRRILNEIGSIHRMRNAGNVTDKDFHRTRKSVSRLVSFYDTASLFAPSEGIRATVRFLSTINGLMGAEHDKMCFRRTHRRRDYTRVNRPWPATIAKRLDALVAAADATWR